MTIIPKDLWIYLSPFLSPSEFVVLFTSSSAFWKTFDSALKYYLRIFSFFSTVKKRILLFAPKNEFSRPIWTYSVQVEGMKKWILDPQRQWFYNLWLWPFLRTLCTSPGRLRFLSVPSDGRTREGQIVSFTLNIGSVHWTFDEHSCKMSTSLGTLHTCAVNRSFALLNNSNRNMSSHLDLLRSFDPSKQPRLHAFSFKLWCSPEQHPTLSSSIISFDYDTARFPIAGNWVNSDCFGYQYFPYEENRFLLPIPKQGKLWTTFQKNSKKK